MSNWEERGRPLRPIVLVHGAWLGGWAWHEVVPILWRAGHRTYAPTLTGLGERAHLGSTAVNLDTHIDDICAVLHAEDLTDVCLVGHSYAGMVITGVADRLPERLSHLVYLDAFVPRDGDSMHTIVPADDVARAREAARRDGAGWRIPLDPEIRATMPRADWMGPRFADQPLGTYEQPVRSANPAAAPLKRTYIQCTVKPVRDLFAPCAEAAQADPDWTLRTLAGDHLAMVTQPGILAALLLDVAAS